MREDASRQAYRDALGAQHQQQRQLAGQGDRLHVAAIVAGDERGQVFVEDFFARQVGESTFNVSGGRRAVAGVDVSEVSLAFDEEAFVGQVDQGIGDGGVAVRMVLHGMTDNVGHLDEASVITVMQGVQDAALDRLEPVLHMWNGAIADDIGGIGQEIAIHERA